MPTHADRRDRQAHATGHGEEREMREQYGGARATRSTQCAPQPRAATASRSRELECLAQIARRRMRAAELRRRGDGPCGSPLATSAQHRARRCSAPQATRARASGAARRGCRRATVFLWAFGGARGAGRELPFAARDAHVRYQRASETARLQSQKRVPNPLKGSRLSRRRATKGGAPQANRPVADGEAGWGR